MVLFFCLKKKKRNKDKIQGLTFLFSMFYHFRDGDSYFPHRLICHNNIFLLFRRENRRSLIKINQWVVVVETHLLSFKFVL